LQNSQTKVKKKLKNKLNPKSAFGTLTDNEIAMVLAIRAKSLRLAQNKKQSDFAKEAQLSSPTTYSNYEQKGAISMINFIKVMRAFGRLEELEKLLLLTTKEEIEKLENKRVKRVVSVL
jgi:transcriptional regulator with XRE-family HTH domain